MSNYKLKGANLDEKQGYLPVAAFVLLLAACAPVATQSPPTNTPLPLPTATPEPSPTPEPPGPRVVFVSNRGGDKNSSQLYIPDVEFGEITLLDTGFDNVVFPKWSPDGSKVLFAVTGV